MGGNGVYAYPRWMKLFSVELILEFIEKCRLVFTLDYDVIAGNCSRRVFGYSSHYLKAVEVRVPDQHVKHESRAEKLKTLGLCFLGSLEMINCFSLNLNKTGIVVITYIQSYQPSTKLRA